MMAVAMYAAPHKSWKNNIPDTKALIWSNNLQK